MKKIIMISLCLIACFGMANTVTAGDYNSDMEMEIGLPCTGNCLGPGVASVSLSGNSYVLYSAEANVGGQINGEGEGLAVMSQSGKGTDEINLIFVVRANQSAGQTDDNNIYQIAPGTLGSAVPSAMIGSLSGYVVRGTTTQM